MDITLYRIIKDLYGTYAAVYFNNEVIIEMILGGLNENEIRNIFDL